MAEQFGDDKIYGPTQGHLLPVSNCRPRTHPDPHEGLHPWQGPLRRSESTGWLCDKVPSHRTCFCQVSGHGETNLKQHVWQGRDSRESWTAGAGCAGTKGTAGREQSPMPPSAARRPLGARGSCACGGAPLTCGERGPAVSRCAPVRPREPSRHEVTVSSGGLPYSPSAPGIHPRGGWRPYRGQAGVRQPGPDITRTSFFFTSTHSFAKPPFCRRSGWG